MPDKQFNSVSEAMEDTEKRIKTEQMSVYMSDSDYRQGITLLAKYWEKATRQEHDGKYNQSSYFFENFMEQIEDDIGELLPDDEGL